MAKLKTRKWSTHEEMLDRYIGKRGTPKREQFEFELELENVGYMIKLLRKRKGLTQDELGDLVGVQKAQISKLEKDGTNMTIGTLLKVLTALRAEIKVESI